MELAFAIKVAPSLWDFVHPRTKAIKIDISKKDINPNSLYLIPIVL
jgi:hypothetical protein